jgi:hypothetical protein
MIPTLVAASMILPKSKLMDEAILQINTHKRKKIKVKKDKRK